MKMMTMTVITTYYDQHAPNLAQLIQNYKIVMTMTKKLAQGLLRFRRTADETASGAAAFSSCTVNALIGRDPFATE
jgi:hypothetical protein